MGGGRTLQLDYNKAGNRVSIPTTQTDQIEIVVNGSPQSIPRALKVIDLLAFLGIAGDRVAIELDGAIVRKHDWAATVVAAGSKLEIVQFVGGG